MIAIMGIPVGSIGAGKESTNHSSLRTAHPDPSGKTGRLFTERYGLLTQLRFLFGKIDERWPT